MDAEIQKYNFPDLFTTNIPESSTVYLNRLQPERKSIFTLQPSIQSTITEMPLYWTGVDTRNAILSSIVPASVAAVNSMVIGSRRNLQAFNTGPRTPQWFLRDPRVFTAVDLAVLSPLGYASYLVYKNGGGFDYTDTTVALGLYGANILVALAAAKVYTNKSSTCNCVQINSGLVADTATATAIAFGKIDKNAGYWMIPYAVWTGYLAAMAFYVHYSNKKVVAVA